MMHWCKPHTEHDVEKVNSNGCCFFHLLNIVLRVRLAPVHHQSITNSLLQSILIPDVVPISVEHEGTGSTPATRSAPIAVIEWQPCPHSGSPTSLRPLGPRVHVHQPLDQQRAPAIDDRPIKLRARPTRACACGPGTQTKSSRS